MRFARIDQEQSKSLFGSLDMSQNPILDFVAEFAPYKISPQFYKSIALSLSSQCSPRGEAKQSPPISYSKCNPPFLPRSLLIFFLCGDVGGKICSRCKIAAGRLAEGILRLSTKLQASVLMQRPYYPTETALSKKNT